MLAATAAAALIAVPAAWYYGSPWWTLWRVREAARAKDWARLDGYVDLGSIAADSKARHLATRRSLVASIPADDPGLRRLLAMIDRSIADPRVMDFRPWLASIPIRFAGSGGGAGDSGYRPFVVHRGLDAFEVRQEGADAELGPMLTFHRHGLGWKLSGVRWGQQ